MFIQEFPDWFVLECRMNMSDTQFEGWFNSQYLDNNVTHVGYVSTEGRSWNRPYVDLIPFEGKKMMLVLHSSRGYFVCDHEMVIKEIRKETMKIILDHPTRYGIDVGANVLVAHY